jgi:hypothetical protein
LRCGGFQGVILIIFSKYTGAEEKTEIGSDDRPNARRREASRNPMEPKCRSECSEGLVVVWIIPTHNAR